MNKLRNGRFTEYRATVEEVIATIDAIKALVEKYHWEDKKMLDPYGHWTTVNEFISKDGFKNFQKYTFDSKGILIGELNGFIEYCVNPWEKLENEPKVKVKIVKTGVVKEYPESIAHELLIDDLVVTA